MDKFHKEKPNQHGHSSPTEEVMMETELPKNISIDVRAENAPINIKNLG